MAREGDAHLGFITGSSLSFWFMHSVVNLFKDDFVHRFMADYILVPGPYLHENRNRLTDEFIQAGREWLLMVDNDMVFEPRDVWALFEVADASGPGIYTAPYLSEEATIVAGVWDAKVPGVYHPLLKIPRKPTPIGVVGAGFTLIHREVFEAVGPAPYSTLVLDSDAEHETVFDRGEDISFCWRAREAGFTPVLVPQSNPGHQKTMVIYPSGLVRNILGEDVNLVMAEDDDNGNTRIAPEEVRL